MNRYLLLVPLIALAACSQEPEQSAGDGDLVAKGEILGGTISDDMLPLESVTSQSPPLAGEEERLRQLAEEQNAENDQDGEEETAVEVVPAPPPVPLIEEAPAVPAAPPVEDNEN